MQNLQTGDVRLVANAAEGITEESGTQSVRLGILADGYELGGVGNFNGSTHPGVLLTAPEQVSPGYSKVTGLACWTLDNAFNMSPGWLEAMVTTWDGGDFAMDDADRTGVSDALINAKYYSFELIGTGDLNGDGIQDVVLQNTEDGGIASWLIGSDAKYYAACGIGTLTAGQTFAGVGDVNGDGMDDILFTDTDGSLKAWTVQEGARMGLLALG